MIEQSTDSGACQPTAKKDYVAPALNDLGSIADLVQALPGAGADGGGYYAYTHS